MALEQEDIEQIQALITKSIQATPEASNVNVRYELELRERTTRVEEKLKHQRELMLMNFAQIEKHIEQVDRQLKQMRSDFENRFEKIEK